MLPILTSAEYEYLALAVLLLAIVFAYRQGRGAVSASGRPLAWTHVPLSAFALASLGPSAFAIMIYLGYRFGLLQPPPAGYSFSTFIRDLPFEFAIINWGFVALYVICRLWPNVGSARSAMWLSVVAMSLPNILLFALAPTMVSDAFDAGQGIGIIEATVIFPIFALIWSPPYPSILDPDSGVGLVISLFMAPIPFLGLLGWLVGQFIGWTAANFLRKTAVRS